MRNLLICCCVASLSSAGLAEPATAPIAIQKSSPDKSEVAASDQNSQAVGEKKTCRSLEVGFSHRTERVCMTAKQWEEYDRGEGS